MNDKVMWLVILEWDGHKPKTTWYNRLESMGLVVRGDKNDKEKSPLDRRANSYLAREGRTNSVIVQEGAILCPSEMLARQIAVYAEEERAKNGFPKVIMVYSANNIHYSMSAEDVKVFHQIEGVLGRRGHPTGPKDDFAVTCHEEAWTYQVQDLYAVAVCPGCGCGRIHTRQGEKTSFAIPENVPVLEAWKRTRFATGDFEVPDIGDALPPANVSILNAQEAAGVAMIEKSKGLLDYVGRMKTKTALAVLDAVLMARTYISVTARNESRMRAVVELYSTGVPASAVSIMESIGEYDLLDASSVMEPDKVAALWKSFREKS